MLKKAVFALAIGTLTMSGVAASAEDKIADKGEEKLAKMLEGREAGEPVSCISTTRFNGLEVIDRTAVVYDGGKTIYVARPTDPRMLDPWDILVIDRYSGSRLCSLDIVRTIDQSTRFPTGVVFLSDFIPYTKIKTAED